MCARWIALLLRIVNWYLAICLGKPNMIRTIW